MNDVTAGVAAFAAERSYANHCAQNGVPQSHHLAKKLLAGFAGAEADKVLFPPLFTLVLPLFDRKSSD